MTVLLTRPEAESRETARELAALGLASLTWPLTRIEPVPAPVEPPEGTDGLVFTSANAVRVFAAACSERALPVLAVGARTAALARETGFAEVRSADGDAQALARLAASSGLRRLFHACARHRAADLATVLAPEGIDVAERVVYAATPTGPPPPAVAAALAAGEVRIVTIWSARNARIFRELWRAAPPVEPDRLSAVAISPAAGRPLQALGFGTVLEADRPDRPAMLGAIRRADAALRR